jgi:DNA-3-methyladenine glycosylase II
VQKSTNVMDANGNTLGMCTRPTMNSKRPCKCPTDLPLRWSMKATAVVRCIRAAGLRREITWKFGGYSMSIPMEPKEFTGVKTTKIYCFPWCTAPAPKAQNTRMFPSRESAERAGFRGCRTCFSGLPSGVWEDVKTHIDLTPPLPFNFDEILAYLTRSPNECLYRVEAGKIYKWIRIQDTDFIIRIQSAGPRKLEIYFEGTPPDKKSIRMEAARYVWDWFDMGTDLQPFYKMAEKDSVLKGLIERHAGLRIVGIQDLFEALAWAVIGQQINLGFAYTLKRRLVETYGKQWEYQGNTYYQFPDPQMISLLTKDQLSALQFTQKKSEYLIEIARKIADGELSNPQLLATEDAQMVEQELTQIRGIGHWTANYVMMRCLRHRAAFPIADIGLHNAVKLWLGLERKPTLSELVELFTPWAGWEAYVTFYFWRSLVS